MQPSRHRRVPKNVNCICPGRAPTETNTADPPAMLKRFVFLCLLALGGFIGFAVYESVALGLPPVREEPAFFTNYHLARSAFALAMSWLIVRAVSSGRSRRSTLAFTDLGSRDRTWALLGMAAALLWTALLVASPETFGALAQEDSAIEWASAILLFAGSGLFAAEFLCRIRSRSRGVWIEHPGVLLAAGFSILFFLVAMEEISWMQRIIGFQTPSELTEINWQHEFNLHNIQTDLSETLYYLGAGIFLILLPLVAEAAPHWIPAPLSDFVPGRAVMAVSAPLSIFNYGHWNLIPVQATVMITLFVLLAYAEVAGRRANGKERLLFLFLAGGVAAGQGLVLAYGPTMPQMPNATEFKEFFIALGLACFAVGAFQRSSQRVTRERSQLA